MPILLLCLDRTCAVVAELLHNLRNVNLPLSLELSQANVTRYQSPASARPRTVVQKDKIKFLIACKLVCGGAKIDEVGHTCNGRGRALVPWYTFEISTKSPPLIVDYPEPPFQAMSDTTNGRHLSVDS